MGRDYIVYVNHCIDTLREGGETHKRWDICLFRLNKHSLCHAKSNAKTVY